MNVCAYIEQATREYNKVIALSEEFCENFNEEFLKQVYISGSKILILSTKRLDVKEKQIDFKQLDVETANILYMLYYTYEFADNFIFLDRTSTFATISNFVQTGILTLEEAWQAMLGE